MRIFAVDSKKNARGDTSNGKVDLFYFRTKNRLYLW